MTFLGGTESRGYGLYWGAGSGDNRFCFTISANGKFRIEYFIDAENFIVCDWTENSAIKRGKKINILEVIKNNEMLHFKINKEVVFTTEFIPFFGDFMGFIIFNEMKVVVDYYLINN